MAVLATTVVASVTGGAGYLDAVRLPDGRLYCVRYESTTSPTKSVGYISTNEGATWTAESWSGSIGAPSSSNGGTDPKVMVDPSGNVWVAMTAYNGGNVPYLIRRNEDRQIWGQPGVAFSGYVQLSQKTSVAYFDAVMDSAFTTSGIWNVACCFEDSGTLYYADIVQGVSPSSDVAVSTATTSITDCKIAATSGGTKNIAWVDDGSLWGAQKVGKSGTWSTPVEISDAAHTVTGLDALTIQDTHQPAAIYRMDNSGTTNLYLTELDADSNSWTQTRVWDGTNNFGFYAGSALSYDQRGTPWVVAMYDAGGAGTAELYEFSMVRVLGATTWGVVARTSSSGGDAAQVVLIDSHTPGGYGYHPNHLYQGACYFAFNWTNIASDQDVLFINRDTYTQAATVYPTIFSTASGELPYRAGDTETRSSIAFDDEGSATTDFPTIAPDFGMVEHHTFESDVFTTKAGYTIRTALMPSKRRLFDVAFTNRSEADKDTIRDFVNARMKDEGVFNFTHPETAEEIPVRINSFDIPFEKVWSGVYSVAFQMIEVL